MFTTKAALINSLCAVVILLIALTEWNLGMQAEPVQQPVKVSYASFDQEAWDKLIAEARYPANHQELERFYKSAIEKAEKIKKTEARNLALADSFSNLGVFYMDTNRLAEAKQLLDQAIQIAEVEKFNNLYLAHFMENRAILALKEKDYRKADQCSERVLELYKNATLNDPSCINGKDKVAYLYCKWIRSHILLGKEEPVRTGNKDKGQNLM